MLVALASGSGDALVQEGFGFCGPVVLRESLRVHLVAGNVIGICLQQKFEMGLGAGEVVFTEAFEGDAVACEGVVGIPREEFFEFLAAGFVLCAHVRLAYYTRSGARSPIPQGLKPGFFPGNNVGAKVPTPS